MMEKHKRIKQKPRYGKYLYEYLLVKGEIHKNKFKIVYQDGSFVYYKKSGNSNLLSHESWVKIKDMKNLIFDKKAETRYLSGYIDSRIYSLNNVPLSNIFIDEKYLEELINFKCENALSKEQRNWLLKYPYFEESYNKRQAMLFEEINKLMNINNKKKEV